MLARIVPAHNWARALLAIGKNYKYLSLFFHLKTFCFKLESIIFIFLVFFKVLLQQRQQIENDFKCNDKLLVPSLRAVSKFFPNFLAK